MLLEEITIVPQSVENDVEVSRVRGVSIGKVVILVDALLSLASSLAFAARPSVLPLNQTCARYSWTTRTNNS